MKIVTTEQQAKPRTRRLRKKLRVGEFQEHGFAIDFRFDSQSYTLDQALDHWIEFVESQGWGFYGGGGEESDTMSGYLVRFERGTLGEDDQECARQWLDNQPGFACIQCSELSDVWHGPWKE
ncbi:50S ribosome-binding protein YggL [Aeromonas taiwanensis]|uniref:50S ribosome-binding protein YggL n=1 Tax=Aeromonas taiwanensis TaxID=633417 RepID=UPI00248DFE65|nr:50S ribosome-binding protein YggL [Aeromonas taiwanensis]